MLAEAAGWTPSWLDVLLTWVVGTVIVVFFTVTISIIVWACWTLFREEW